MPEQPRVPAGSPQGGEWTKASSGGVSGAVSSKGDFAPKGGRKFYEFAREQTRKAKRAFLAKEGNREFSAYTNYIGSGFRGINKSLRAGTEVEEAKIIDTMIEEAGYTLPHDVKVYRGLGNRGRLLPEVGKSFTDLGYQSTSLEDTVPRSLGGVVEVTLPKGLRVLVGGDHESEFILPRGLSMRVKSRGEDGGPWRGVIENE